MKRVLMMVGSRAELIRLAPIIRTLRDDYSSGVSTRWIHAAAQPEQIWAAGALFGLAPDGELAAPHPAMAPLERSWELTKAFAQEMEAGQPDLLIVQGDSRASVLAAQQAFVRRIPVVHVQGPAAPAASVHTGPEAANGRMLAALSSFHCVPNASTASALRSEGFPFYEIGITGDTVVDAIQWVGRHQHRHNGNGNAGGHGNGYVPDWAAPIGDGHAASRIGRLIANWSRNRILTPRAFEPFRGDCTVSRAAHDVIRTSREHLIDF